MSIRSHVRALGALACLALVAGCGSSTSDGSSPTSSGVGAPATHPRSATPTTTASASPTSNSTAAGAPGVPEAARQHTTAGAIAFAKYYIHLINDTGLHPKTGVLEPLALKGCKSCASYAGNVEYLVKHKEHNSGNAIRLRSSHRITGETGMVIESFFDQTKIAVVDDSGSVDISYPLVKNIGMVMFLHWTHDGWRISEIQSDRTRVGS